MYFCDEIIQRWIISCFKTTPVHNILRKISLLPVKALCNYYKRKHALRMCLTETSINPVIGRLHPSFSAINSFRLLSFQNASQNKVSYRHAIWYNPFKNKIHLVIDKLAYNLNKHFPLLMEVNYNLKLLRPEGYFNNTPLSKIFHTLIYGEQNNILSPSTGYSFSPLRTSFLSISINKFIASQLYQMKSSNSYL